MLVRLLRLRHLMKMELRSKMLSKSKLNKQWDPLLLAV